MSGGLPRGGTPSYQTLLGYTLANDPNRRVFFSFHYQRDIWRVNVVRQHWIAKDRRDAAGYFDGSLWEKAQTEGKAKVKKLIDDGLSGSSATCVLIGAETYNRHWVQYEIFRSIELGKGVFGVRIHQIKNEVQQVDLIGTNPFDCLGFGTRPEFPGKMVPVVHYTTSGWTKHSDADPINSTAAPYLVGGTTPLLSSLFPVYDWINDNGYANFGSWVKAAARHAQR